MRTRSRDALVALLVGGHAGTFDFIYIDESHQAADVLSDLTLSFPLCKIGGLITCDDYMWSFGADPGSIPKMAWMHSSIAYAGRVQVALASILSRRRRTCSARPGVGD
jgi:predicted O-methyltransferase YrrM